jgi:hypothetical protein
MSIIFLYAYEAIRGGGYLYTFTFMLEELNFSPVPFYRGISYLSPYKKEKIIINN